MCQLTRTRFAPPPLARRSEHGHPRRVLSWAAAVGPEFLRQLRPVVVRVVPRHEVVVLVAVLVLYCVEESHLIVAKCLHLSAQGLSPGYQPGAPVQSMRSGQPHGPLHVAGKVPRQQFGDVLDDVHSALNLCEDVVVVVVLFLLATLLACLLEELSTFKLHAVSQPVGFSLSGDFETAGFAAFILKFLTVSHFPTEFGASPHNTTVSLGRCDLGKLGPDCTNGLGSHKSNFGSMFYGRTL